MHRLKKPLMYVGIAFAVFYLFSRPAQAADAVNGLLNSIFTGADQLAVFATKVLK
ncbi:hypothetical protein [Nonomuraea basaltis]|uniref:hypothetical protein n=1 Tax=Nonomuraea basaltis TaxID=2495887 RepID=UPI001486A7CC|nr:hypothetical protein [Nonomuraea basaltis]